MFVLIVDIVVKEGFVERFREAIIKQAETSLATEDGCRRFEVLEAPGEPRGFTLIEAYADEAAFEEVHRHTQHFARYAETTAGWVESKSHRRLATIWPE